MELSTALHRAGMLLTLRFAYMLSTIPLFLKLSGKQEDMAEEEEKNKNKNIKERERERTRRYFSSPSVPLWLPAGPFSQVVIYRPQEVPFQMPRKKTKTVAFQVHYSG